MKYIRTKDGIWKYDEQEQVAVQPENENHDTRVLIKPKFIKQADNLKNLTDKYVVCCTEDYEYPEFYPSVVEEWQLEDYISNSNFIIYGAIWTDKGLIYVAKMNEKGELELL